MAIAEDIRDYIRKPIESFVNEGEEIYIVYSHTTLGADILRAFRKEEDALAYQKYHISYSTVLIKKIILE